MDEKQTLLRVGLPKMGLPGAGPPSIGQRIAATRKKQFVGREAECDLLRTALLSPDLPFCLLYLHGPGGVGKTTLLQSFADLCDTLQIRHFRLDARNMEPSPAAFSDALRTVLEAVPQSEPLDFFRGTSERCVLFLDTFELLDGMQAWLRDGFLPQISANVLVIAAGRQTPARAWPLDSGWQSVFRAVRLQNFDTRESRAYLKQRAFPLENTASAIAFTHGHPLALSLLADLHGSVPHAADLFLSADKLASPEVVDTLLKRFMAETPSGLRKSALELCAVVRGTNEALLRDILFSDGTVSENTLPAKDEAAALFAWLRTLSFIDFGPSGLFPHDIAREALLIDLRWRDPDGYVELHRRARRYYIHQLEQASGEETQKRFLYDGVFLHRDSPIVRTAFSWHETPSVFADRLQTRDLAPIEKMVADYEGEDAAKAARHWLTNQPEATVVFRASGSGAGEDPADGEPVAFFTMLALHKMTDADFAADPAAQAVNRHIQKAGPLRENEGAACLRFWMAHDTYQAPSPLQSLLIVHALRHFLTRGQRLAYTFFCCQDPQNWQAVFDYAGMSQVAEYLLDDRCCGIFGHDWRRVPLAKWLETIAEKEIGAINGNPGVSSSMPAQGGDALPSSDTYVALSQTEFADAVQDGLRYLNRPDKLRSNLLLRSRLFTPPVRGERQPKEAASPAALKKQLEETAESLNGPNVRMQRGYLALRHTYLTPASTQEDAADRLGLPFSTYRRHLAEGIADLTAALWQKEIHGYEN